MNSFTTNKLFLCPIGFNKVHIVEDENILYQFNKYIKYNRIKTHRYISMIITKNTHFFINNKKITSDELYSTYSNYGISALISYKIINELIYITNIFCNDINKNYKYEKL